ncbi:unnamed protein product [Microthlaspi erraticum]|uniref:Uncharacterized protein n=1 Tax=Microthlaspi erraticum TaxID=1685480 RepID=A0A6D2JFP6_9BRAS|nr:unnamed protein product [Microthlaspi erraticum]
MSRSGVTTKRVKTAPDGSIENQRPTVQSGWPRNERSTLGQNIVRDRPNAAVDPKPVLKPISYFQARLNPKPPQKT